MPLAGASDGEREIPGRPGRELICAVAWPQAFPNPGRTLSPKFEDENGRGPG